jgi:UTP--glucose-1-phosphate uridylyltransferase
MIKIDTAVFPIAGLGTRFLPATKSIPKEMLPVWDKPLIQYAVEEARACGIKRFIFITARDKEAIENHFDRSLLLESFLSKTNKHKELDLVQSCCLDFGQAIFIRQQEPLGLGHAVLCAKHFLNNNPFAVLLADDLIMHDPGCLQQMITHYTHGNMVAVKNVDPSRVSSYGIIDPVLEKNSSHAKHPLISAKDVVEKPSAQTAPSSTAVIGRYILDPVIFDFLETTSKGAVGEIQLTDAIRASIQKRHKLEGLFFKGEHFDCGQKEGWLHANNHVASL